MYKFCSILILFLLNSCALSYFTEPDDIARQEMLKNDLARASQLGGGCASKGGGTCYAKNRQYHYRRYKLNEQQYISMLEEKDDALRTQAVTEISEKSYLDSDVIDRIKNMATKDPSKWVRRASVKAITKISGHQAIPTLKLALKDKDKWVRHSAQQCLAKLD